MGASDNGNSTVSASEATAVLILDRVQLVFAIIGSLLNIGTFIILWKSKVIAPMMSIVMRYQACLDFLVCGMGAVILVQPPGWSTGNNSADVGLCYLWHSQAMYWGVFMLAGWNLMVLAIERHMAVCRPMFYNSVGNSYIYYYLVPIYIIGSVCNLPAFFEAQYRNGTCHSEYYFDGDFTKKFFAFYSVFYFFSFYLLPCVSFFLLYGHVVVTLRKRQSSDSLGGSSGSSSVIDRAASQMTKSAVVCTVVFILSVGPDSWLYMLGALDVAPYIFNSPIQKVLVFFTLINSCANPVVYFFLMPGFKHDVLKFFTCNSFTSKQSLADSNNSGSKQTVNTVTSEK